VNLQDGLERMPQKGAMLLIERIVSADETTIDCIARNHMDADYPLRINGQLMPVSLVEIGAQAAAAHASFFGVGGHHKGLLLALHTVEVAEGDAHNSGEQLRARATQLHFDDIGARYSFELTAGDRVVLNGQAMLKMEAVER